MEKNLGLFKKSLQVIFVCETNPDPTGSYYCFLIYSFSIGFFFIPSCCRKGDSGLVLLKKVAYGVFLKRPKNFRVS